MPESNEIEPSLSVSKRVLSAFVDAVADDQDMGEIADRLRLTILVNGELSESSLRDALFGGDQP